ncbi:MAG: sigma-70 family RNA polymerase sigma factor [Clostridia bacterium]|nr:sigma-70 family RNA polymerase sigma factor [Clostridia bacterium]MBQ8235855.1 sigma-70 family RNA polymerase sigma factor [Clostridia bacterium]MBQ8399419.1 sigma-70 family RNA polymerase sigma factor [Clostridia bacterium]
MAEQQDINNLLSLVKKGDQQAFYMLAEQFEPLIAGAAKRFCKPPVFAPEDAQDLRQEAMLALFKAAKRYDAGQNAVTFGLYAKICINNRLICARRHRLRKLRTDGRGVGRPRKEAPIKKGNKGRVPLPTDIQLERLMALARHDLTDIEEKAFDLYLSGATYKEIAQQLGCSVKMVDNALTRAKRKVKKHAQQVQD